MIRNGGGLETIPNSSEIVQYLEITKKIRDHSREFAAKKSEKSWWP